MSDKADHRDFLPVDRISPPAKSNPVRAQRVLSVEAVINAERAILWPDAGGEQPVESDNVEAARAHENARRR